MSDVRTFFAGANLNTLVLVVGLIFGFGVTWQKQVNAVEAASAASRADMVALKVEVDRNEAGVRERLASSDAERARLSAEMTAIRRETVDAARVVDQHEYRLTNAEGQIGRAAETLDALSDKIDSIDRNVLLLAQRAGVQPEANKEGGRR